MTRLGKNSELSPLYELRDLEIFRGFYFRDKSEIFGSLHPFPPFFGRQNMEICGKHEEYTKMSTKYEEVNLEEEQEFPRDI